MTVVSAVAGPSRLPFNTICHSVRRLPLRQTPCCSSRQASTTTALDDPSTAEGESAVNDDGDGSMTGYRRWLDKTGRQYQNVRKGQQAIWLGGRVVSILRQGKTATESLNSLAALSGQSIFPPTSASVQRFTRRHIRSATLRINCGPALPSLQHQ